MKVSFLQLSPFVANRQTAYDKGALDNDLPIRSIFYGGMDASTKFFRIYDVNTDLFGVQVRQLRHIITPTIGYSYNPDPTLTSNKLKQIDAVDAIARSDAATLGLSNKLQTKRDGATVDLLDTRVSTVYRFNQEAENDSRRGMSDILTELTALPYRWLRVDADATYTHSGLSESANYGKFSSASYDFYFAGTPERSFGIGQRYERKESSQITYSLNWRLTPKWRFEFYNRYEIKGSPELKRGMKEQEYTLSRDLHCWVMDLSLRTDMVEGDSFWIVFHLNKFSPFIPISNNNFYRVKYTHKPIGFFIQIVS